MRLFRSSPLDEGVVVAELREVGLLNSPNLTVKCENMAIKTSLFLSLSSPSLIKSFVAPDNSSEACLPTTSAQILSQKEMLAQTDASRMSHDPNCRY